MSVHMCTSVSLHIFVAQYRYQVLSEGKRSRVKGGDLALMDHCTDAQSVAVGSRIVGEHLLDITQGYIHT